MRWSWSVENIVILTFSIVMMITEMTDHEESKTIIELTDSICFCMCVMVCVHARVRVCALYVCICVDIRVHAFMHAHMCQYLCSLLSYFVLFIKILLLITYMFFILFPCSPVYKVAYKYSEDISKNWRLMKFKIVDVIKRGPDYRVKRHSRKYFYISKTCQDCWTNLIKNKKRYIILGRDSGANLVLDENSEIISWPDVRCFRNFPAFNILMEDFKNGMACG